MPYQLRLDSAPLIVVVVIGVLSDSELHSMNADATRAMQTHIADGRRTVVVLDFSEAGPIAPRQRKLIGEWRTEVRELTRKVSVGMAMVVTSPVIRGVLTAISWFQKEPVPVVFVASFDEGVDWAVKRCDEESVLIAPNVRSRLLAKTSTKLRTHRP